MTLVLRPENINVPGEVCAQGFHRGNASACRGTSGGVRDDDYTTLSTARETIASHEVTAIHKRN
ncbi:hypothetical protein [Streptomyces sp. PTD5-9]|uniref:hypothetical protein n=1 Tax=Streptomyces sp. PTD5-9 TaxID=3120150 RepID=UPI003009A5DD